MENGKLFGAWDPNPDGLGHGRECYGVYVPAFLPGSGLLDGVHDAVVHGMVATSYDDVPVGGREDAVNVLPDALFPGTGPMDPLYRIAGNWAVFRDAGSAAAFRAEIAGKAIAAHETEIRKLCAMLPEGGKDGA